jgi:hypothetical protein
VRQKTVVDGDAIRVGMRHPKGGRARGRSPRRWPKLLEKSEALC